jgi:hypothetical protein
MQKSQSTSVSSSESVSSLFSKVLLGLILIGGIAYAGYYFGARHNQPSTIKKALVSSTPSPTVKTWPIDDAEVMSASPSPSLQTSVTQIKMSSTVINGGRKSEVFQEYKLSTPDGWAQEYTNDSTSQSNNLMLKKKDHILSIGQSNAGAGRCLYEGDVPQSMSPYFNTFVEFSGKLNTYRRGPNDAVHSIVCQKKNDSFMMPTDFGYITYTTPASPDPQILAEMDAIVASLKK